ncbi:unnamed protein product [Polarella glacialis]|uniref:Uncharacterized protein n=1 Tax=Polarella glacialis TaxID=89957 RepID=A0A813GMD4_POLGL|nr:unnamed protein product [Polarella glacialis]
MAVACRMLRPPAARFLGCARSRNRHGLRYFAATAAPGSSSSASSSVGWPEHSFIFEPPWATSMVPSQLGAVPNMFETFFVLREARGLLLGGQNFEGVDGFNTRFMDRFLEFHKEVLAAQQKQPIAPVARGGQPVQDSSWLKGRADLSAAGARSTWSSQRPLGARTWELLPYSCQVVQARRAEHHELGWLQVTARLAAQESWTTGRGTQLQRESRFGEHFVVFEIPRTNSGVAQDFRVAEIKLDAPPEAAPAAEAK